MGLCLHSKNSHRFHQNREAEPVELNSVKFLKVSIYDHIMALSVVSRLKRSRTKWRCNFVEIFKKMKVWVYASNLCASYVGVVSELFHIVYVVPSILNVVLRHLSQYASPTAMTFIALDNTGIEIQWNGGLHSADLQGIWRARFLQWHRSPVLSFYWRVS